MRWFIEVSRVGESTGTEKYCLEAKQWQSALQEARKLRGDAGPLSKFSIELLDDGYRAVDPTMKIRYLVSKAPYDAPLSGPGNSAGAAAAVEAAPRTEPMAAPEPLDASEPAAKTDPMGAPVPSAPSASPEPTVRAPAESRPPRAARKLVVPEDEVPPAPPPPSESRRAMGNKAPSFPPEVHATQRSIEATKAPDFQLIRKREEEPTAQSPIAYREYAYAVKRGTDRRSAEVLLRVRFRDIQTSLADRPQGKFVQLAVFDHVFERKPVRPPLATLAWKDWRGEPVLQFPAARDRGSVPPPPPPSSAAARSAVAPITPPPAPAVSSWPPPAVPSAPPAARAPSTPPHAATPSKPPPAPAPSTPPPAPAPSTPPTQAAAPSTTPMQAAAPSTTPDAAAPPSTPPPATARSFPPPPAASSAPPQPAAPSKSPAAAAPSPPARAAAPSAPPTVRAPSTPPPAAAPSTPPAAAAPSKPPPAIAAPSSPPPAPAASEPRAAVPSSPPAAAPSSPPTARAPSDSPAAAAPVKPAKTEPMAAPAPLEPAPQEPAGPRRRRPGEDLIGELFEAMHDLHFAADVVSGAQFVLTLLENMLPSEGVIVHVFDIDKRQFVVVRAAGPEAQKILLHRTPDKQPLFVNAMRRTRCLRFDDAKHEDLRGGRWDLLGVTPKSALCGPVQQGGRYLGLIELANPLGGGPYHESEANALDYICEQFADFVAARPIIVDADLVLGKE